MAKNYPFDDSEYKPFYRRWLDKFISKIGGTNNPKNIDEKVSEHLLQYKKNIERYKLPEISQYKKNNPPNFDTPYHYNTSNPKPQKLPDFDFDLYLKGLFPDEPIFPPTQESMEIAEIAEDGFLGVTTARVVSDMLANAYSHLSKGDYESARKQLGYLKSLDLNRVLDGDDKAIESTKKAIITLEEELRV